MRRRRRAGGGSGAGRRGRRVATGLAALALFGAIGWWVVIPVPWGLSSRNPERTALMEQRVREAAERGDSLTIRQEWVTLDRFSSNLQRAVVVAEDYRFREHGGVDWVSLAEEVRWTGDDRFSWTSMDDLRALGAAFRYVWTHRDEIRGRSTITQQLAKNLYWGTDRSFLRKAMEFVVAGRLERRLGKDRILELYLNVAEWGPGIFGAEAAARAYFGRSAADLTLTQAAALAATLPHPLTSNPSFNPGRMAWRRDLILSRLRPGVPPAPLPLPEPEVALPDVPVPDDLPVAGPEPGAPPAAGTDTAGVAVDTLGRPVEPPVVVTDSVAGGPTGSAPGGSPAPVPDTAGVGRGAGAPRVR